MFSSRNYMVVPLILSFKENRNLTADIDGADMVGCWNGVKACGVE